MKKQPLYLIPITIITLILTIIDLSSMLFIFIGEILEEFHKEIKKFNKYLIQKYNNDNNTTKKREDTKKKS